jgi:hypothetical protein
MVLFSSNRGEGISRSRSNMARIKDDEGENWPSLEAARAHAVMIASELWQDGSYEGYAIYVTDDQGKEVAYLPIGGAVH